MKSIFTKEVNRAMIAILILLAFKGAHAAGWPQAVTGSWGDEVVRTLSNRGLNKEAREALTAGTYEGLINEGSRLSTLNRFVLDNRRPGWEDNSRPDRRQTNDFLYYELIPNGVTPDYTDGRFKYFLKTNSAGLGDKEYSLEKPERTRRIALVGDSITRGQGAPSGANYESLLEDTFNKTLTTDTIAHYEILNFAVGGYHITQQLESARVKAAPYKPDVYIAALSDLSVYRRWHGHISTLMYSGIDLKYDFLRDMVRQARLTPKDPIGVFDARLARYRIPTVRWVLDELKALAASEHAELLVILLPTADDPVALEEAFLGVRDVIAEAGIPYIDLLDTFTKVDDIRRYHVADGDFHPNAAGHQLLYDGIYAKLKADPVLMKVLTGTTPTSQSAQAAAAPPR